MAKEWAKPFYNSAAWKSTRKMVLMQCGYTCEMCGNHATEVHHEVELTPDNIHDQSISLNPKLLHPLCGECHKKITLEQKGIKLLDCDTDYCFDADGNLSPRGGAKF